MIATIGISVSGIAVPTAASTLPVAPSPMPSRCPAHSIAFVNTQRAGEDHGEAGEQQDDVHR